MKKLSIAAALMFAFGTFAFAQDAAKTAPAKKSTTATTAPAKKTTAKKGTATKTSTKKAAATTTSTGTTDKK